MEQSPFEKLVEEFPTFCGTWKFVTTFTSSCLRSHEMFHNSKFVQWGVASTLLKPQSGGPPLVCSLWQLIQYTCSIILTLTLHIWGLFRHPQPEDMPRCCDSNPLSTVAWLYYFLNWERLLSDLHLSIMCSLVETSQIHTEVCLFSCQIPASRLCIAHKNTLS
jgi:hypothetical protein